MVPILDNRFFDPKLTQSSRCGARYQGIDKLKSEPRPPGCEKLSSQERYRLRQGSYRIIYEIMDEERVVAIVKVSHRRDIYKQFYRNQDNTF